MNISRQTVDFIIAQEVSNKATYTAKHAHPTWPQGDSGVTIGIGYDLGFNTKQDIASDWAVLGTATVALLQSSAGLKGEAAHSFLQGNAQLKAIVVPYETAVKVFIEKSLPKVAKEVLSIYPGLDLLLPDAVGAIVSMVYNRGASLKGDRRTEMRAIVPMVLAKDYAGIAAQIEASKRLWAGIGMEGLVTRRKAEAALVQNCNRVYAATDTIQLNVSNQV